jgi:hypothetical protein
MSSIDTKKADELARTLFTEVLCPLGAKVGAADHGFFELRPSADAPSYFAAPHRATMTALSDFEPCGPSPHDFVTALGALWAGEGERDLAVLLPGLEGIAGELSVPLETEEADVSAFIYTMF